MHSRVTAVIVVLLTALVVSGPLSAHHSSAAYDMEHPINLKGTVSSVEWTNPHVFIYLNVAGDNGATVQWRVEGNSPNMLQRAGWKKEMLKAGDILVVTGSPAKNGAKILRLVSLTLPNGHKFDGQGFK